MALFLNRKNLIILVLVLTMKIVKCSDSDEQKNKDLEFKGEQNPNANLKETDFHRSELYSYFRLPTGVSKVNDSFLNDAATPQCKLWAKKHHFTRYYIEVEKNKNGYYIAWCCLKKKYEYLTRTYTNLNGNTNTQVEIQDLYNNIKVTKSALKQNAQIINQNHENIKKQMSVTFNNIEKKQTEENLEYRKIEQKNQHKILKKKSMLFSSIFR